MELKFEWDLAKEAINLEKHGVNFVTASKAFGAGYWRYGVAYYEKKEI